MDRPVPADEKPKTYPTGRSCSSCEMPLSIYNKGPRCAPCAGGGERYTGWAEDLIWCIENE